MAKMEVDIKNIPQVVEALKRAEEIIAESERLKANWQELREYTGKIKKNRTGYGTNAFQSGCRLVEDKMEELEQVNNGL